MRPTQTATEAASRATFLALMGALSRPGTIHSLPGDPQGDELRTFVAIGKALLDLETSYYTPEALLSRKLALTGAKVRNPAQAAYHFYPHLYAEDLTAIEQASVGDYLYPDRGATVMIGCRFGDRSGQCMQLSGPGVLNQSPESRIQVSDLPVEFWRQRARRIHYPMGFDAYLIDGQKVIGLPRSTQVELEAVPCM